MKFKEFVISMFSESPGVISFARVITIPIVGFVLGWDSSYVLHAHALPDATVLAGQAAFMVVFYGANRAAGALDKPEK